MTESARREAELEAVREAAAGQVVPLLKASLLPAAKQARQIKDSPAGMIIHGVLMKDVAATTFEGSVHLAAGVASILQLMVRALAAQNAGGDASGLAAELATQYRTAADGRHVADVLDQLLDGTGGTNVIADLLMHDEQALYTLILQLADLTAMQAKALAHTGGTDMDVLWEQIEGALFSD